MNAASPGCSLAVSWELAYDSGWPAQSRHMVLSPAPWALRHPRLSLSLGHSWGSRFASPSRKAQGRGREQRGRWAGQRLAFCGCVPAHGPSPQMATSVRVAPARTTVTARTGSAPTPAPARTASKGKTVSCVSSSFSRGTQGSSWGLRAQRSGIGDCKSQGSAGSPGVHLGWRWGLCESRGSGKLVQGCESWVSAEWGSAPGAA